MPFSPRPLFPDRSQTRRKHSALREFCDLLAEHRQIVIASQNVGESTRAFVPPPQSRNAETVQNVKLIE